MLPAFDALWRARDPLVRVTRFPEGFARSTAMCNNPAAWFQVAIQFFDLFVPVIFLCFLKNRLCKVKVQHGLDN